MNTHVQNNQKLNHDYHNYMYIWVSYTYIHVLTQVHLTLVMKLNRNTNGSGRLKGLMSVMWAKSIICMGASASSLIFGKIWKKLILMWKIKSYSKDDYYMCIVGVICTRYLHKFIWQLSWNWMATSMLVVGLKLQREYYVSQCIIWMGETRATASS